MTYPRNPSQQKEPMQPKQDDVRIAEHALALAPERDRHLGRWGLTHEHAVMYHLGLLSGSHGLALSIPFYDEHSTLVGIKLRFLAPDVPHENRFSWHNHGRQPGLWIPPLDKVADQNPLLLCEGPLKAIALHVLTGQPWHALSGGVGPGVPPHGLPYFQGKVVHYLADSDAAGAEGIRVLTKQLKGVASELKAVVFPAGSRDANDVLKEP